MEMELLAEEMRFLRQSIDTLNHNIINLSKQLEFLDHQTELKNTKNPNNSVSQSVSSEESEKDSEESYEESYDSPENSSAESIGHSKFYPIKLYGKITEMSDKYIYNFSKTTDYFSFDDKNTKEIAFLSAMEYQKTVSLNNPRNNK